MKDTLTNIRLYIATGFILTAALIGIKILIENTTWGHRAERSAFEFLQNQIPFLNQGEDLPLVVADISEVGTGEDQLIDLTELEKIVSAIAKEKPRAMGIDAVLIPESGDLQSLNPVTLDKLAQQTRRYYKLLDSCLLIKENYKVPVFLGVDERVKEDPANWLGGVEYQDLAATVLINEDTTRIPLQFNLQSNPKPLLSLSAALAKSYNAVPTPGYISWAVQTEGDFSGAKTDLDENDNYVSGLVNYAKLDLIRQNKIPVKNAEAVSNLSSKFYNRIVLLGKVDKASDKFEVVGYPEKTFAGVYIHASAVYTLVREPLYELKLWVRLVLDFLFSGIIIIWVASKRYRHINDIQPFDWKKLQSRLSIVSFIAVAVIAICLVRMTNILWLDFLLVAFFLWLHSKIGKYLDREAK